MVKLFSVYIPARMLLLATSDTLVVATALLATLAFGFPAGLSPHLAKEQAFLKITVACLVCMVCMYYYDLYESRVIADHREVVTRMVQVLGTSCLILAFLYYLYPSAVLNREILFLGFAVIGLLLIAWRRFFQILNGLGHLSQRTLLLGHGPLSTCLAEELHRRPEVGMRVVGYLDDPPGSPKDRVGVGGLNAFERAMEVIERERVTNVIITMEERRGRLPLDMLLQLKSRGIKVEDGADVYERVTGKAHLNSLRLSWLLFSPSFHISRTMQWSKRLYSIVFSLTGLLFTLPLMGLVALAIRLDSPGRAILRQMRIGKGGKPFVLYKFRSMHVNADADGLLKPAEEDDDRLTRIGRWLRKTRLDELPQLYNILRGDMSFVGPRPFVPEQELVLAEQIPFYRHRWAVASGATGWAQVHRGYCATLEDNEEKLAYDLFYIRNMSLGLDFLILFQTFKVLILGRGGR
jgi:sugar transferase (PEP-CTERM system associated)